VLKPPFTVGLRLSLEVARASGSGQQDQRGPGWRERLTPIAEREVSSRILPADQAPAPERASEVLARTFADHPMVNVSGRPTAGGVVDRGPQTRSPQAFVLAEVVALPDLAPVPEGGEFPDVTDRVFAGPILVHGALWPHAVGSEDECGAATILLERVVSALPVDLWRRDG
jgi:hypothetical protein